MSYGFQRDADRRWRNAPVREPDHGKARQLFGWLALMLIACSPVAVYLFQQMEYIETIYRLEERRSEQVRLTETERLLRVERAALEALPRVERHASEKLGLVAPERILVVEPAPLDDERLVASHPANRRQP